MSEFLSSGGAPKPASAFAAPSFPLARRLPREPGQLAKNIKLQKRDETAFGNQQRKLVQAKSEKGADLFMMMRSPIKKFVPFSIFLINLPHVFTFSPVIGRSVEGQP